MLSILIVDDEPVIRFGIKASVDWEKEGFRVVGDYANGAEALAHLKQERVDIVITDIKMPVMDGLTLSRQALALDPHIKIILVSSYNDFEYVHQGLKLGVADYILKHTLEPEELLGAAQKCAALITEEIKLENRLVDASEHMHARLRTRYAREMKRYLAGKTDALPPGGYPQWLEGAHAAVCVRLIGVRKLEETHGFLYSSIMVEQCMETFGRLMPDSIALPTEACEWFALIPADSNLDAARKQLRELYGQLAGETGAALAFGWAVGAGTAHIPVGFENSKKACGRAFFEGAGVYLADDVPAAAPRTDCHLPGQLPNPLALSEDRFAEIVLACQAAWRHGGISPSALKEEACRALTLLYKHTVDSFALVEAFEQVFEAESLADLCDRLLEQFAGLGRQMNARPEPQELRNPVEKALAYIQAHYLEAVTLQQVADHVHVSKNYFSILFKKIMGQNFIDYLIDLRIQKAQEMLAQSELRVYEVAEQAGFNDVKYFSKLFKKMTGLSPIDYRDYHLMGRQAGARGDRS